jgi:hypothetical protein
VIRLAMLMVLAVAVPQPTGIGVEAKAADAGDGPSYTVDGQLKFPERYREWIYLTSGLDMSYSPTAMAAGHSTFDNVFVNPSAYRAFLQTGTWPDKTVIVLESRGAEGKHSINTQGKSQTPEVMGLEVHVKDESRAGGAWGFYGFENPVSAKQIARSASCYTCHEQHGAVDTTFVQFYPTLVGLAKDKGTLSQEYLKEMAVEKAAAGGGGGNGAAPKGKTPAP